MTIGEILDQSFDLYRSHWRSFIKLVLAMIVPVSILQLLVGIYQYTVYPPTPGVPPTFHFTILDLLALLILYFVQFVLYLSIIFLAVRYVLNKPVTGREAISYVIRRSFPLAITEILVVLSVLGGFILLIIPGILIGILFSVVMQVMIVEEYYYGDALRRSWSLVKEQMGKTFVVLLVTNLIVVAIAYGVVFAFTIPIGIAVSLLNQHFQHILTVVFSGFMPLIFGIIYPFSIIASTLLYFDLRIHNEGLDIEMLTQQIAQQEGA